MKNKNNSQRELSIFGNFKDSKLEKEYIDYDVQSEIYNIKSSILIFGILFFCFIFADYFLIKRLSMLLLLLFLRGIFLLASLGFYYFIDKIKRKSYVYSLITFFELMCTIEFFIIFLNYDSANYYIQTFGVILMLIAFFSLPNRLSNMVVISVFLTSFYFVSSLKIFSYISLSESSAVVVYTLLVLVFVGLQAKRINFYKRMQYLQRKELSKAATVDSLTNTYNRFKFDEELNSNLIMAKRYNLNLSLIIYDFDNFKLINDKYGHLSGDKILVETSRIVKSSIREVDLLARWGGEEFVVLLPNTVCDDAISLAERLRKSIECYPFHIPENVTCSFGITTLKKEDTTESFLERVDGLLYKAKTSGKNQVVC